MRLILASNSPRRKELLSKLNYSFDVIPAACEEKSYSSAPLEIVKELACRKALDVYGRNREATVIGCDTVVDLDGEALGKPHSKREACEVLSRLSGRAHRVHTGVCIVSLRGVRLFAVTSEVEFYALDAGRIAEYVASGSPMDKAGAYGIQDSGFVADIKGSYSNVMGLPTEELGVILQTIKG